MLECKCIRLRKGEILMAELIDTCWNVNKEEYKINIEEFIELIDTCWNVNDNKKASRYSQCIRINRYMLECKLDL